MPPDYTNLEWRHMKADLLRELALRNVYRPEKVIRVEAIRPWFAEAERDDVAVLVDDLVTEPDCPLEYVTEDALAVWLTDPDEVPEYVRENGGMRF